MDWVGFRYNYNGLGLDKLQNPPKPPIKNTGAMASDEVPQVYLGAPSDIPEGVQFPVRALAGFDRVHLAAGEGKPVILHVEPRQLQYWSTKEGKWVTATGKRTVSVGASSHDLRVEQSIN